MMLRLLGRTASSVAVLAAVLLAAGCNSHHKQPQPALTEVNASSSPLDAFTEEASDSATATEAGTDTFEIRIDTWRFDDGEGKVIHTPHYQIHTTVESDWAIELLPLFAEAALRHYTSVLGDLPLPDRHLRSYMFRNRSEWESMTNRLMPGQAATFRNLGRGGLSTQGLAVLYYIDYWGRPRDTLAIAAHEGWHQYTQTTFVDDLPIWLEEGIATYMEGYHSNRDGLPQFTPERNYERHRALSRAKRRNQLFPLVELTRRSPQSFLENDKSDLLVYYAQVWALTRFLVEGEDGKYDTALRELLQDAAHGRFHERVDEYQTSIGRSSRSYRARNLRFGSDVIGAYFNRDLSIFEQEYRAFVDELTDQTYRRGRRR